MCISVIVIDSVCKVNKSYFPKLFLEECRYKVKVAMKAVTSLMTFPLMMILAKKILRKRLSSL